MTATAHVTQPPCKGCGQRTVPCEALAPWPFVSCTACGLVFRARVEEEAIHAVYAGGDYDSDRGHQYASDEEDADRRRDAIVRLRWLRRHADAGRLLDVGAAGGAFVLEARRIGFAAWGVEPTPTFAARARERHGLDVRTGTLEEVALDPGGLDVATMWHVLEHIPEPRAALERLHAALRPGGTLAIEVPNFGSAVARRMGSGWTSLQPDVHVNQFSAASLRALLERAGFAPVEVSTVPITPYLPVRSRLGPRHLAARAKAAVWLRTGRGEHPHGHELLRAAAIRPVPQPA
jgi:SAM-dependent methyltransferase